MMIRLYIQYYSSLIYDFELPLWYIFKLWRRQVRLIAFFMVLRCTIKYRISEPGMITIYNVVHIENMKKYSVKEYITLFHKLWQQRGKRQKQDKIIGGSWNGHLNIKLRYMKWFYVRHILRINWYALVG